METNDVAAIGYALQMLVHASLSMLFLSRWRSNSFSRHLGIASATTALSGGLFTLTALGYVSFGVISALVEWGRYAVWIVVLFVILRSLDIERLAESYARRYALPLVAVALVVFVFYSGKNIESLGVLLLVSGGTLLAVVLISVLEQIYRNLPSDSTSSLRYVCVGLVVTSALDIFVFLQAISAGDIVADFWAARGFIYVLLALPIAAFGRQSELDAEAWAPRQAVFYSFSLLALGVGGVLWLAAEYYVRNWGGAWGRVAVIVAVVAAIGFVGVMLVSATIRARTRVSLTKIFFQYKYDYRKEWLRFIGTLSESALEHVPTTSVRAVAPIVNSPGGIVWIEDSEGDGFHPVGAWRYGLPVAQTFSRDSGIVRFLRDRQWVIDLNELKSYPSRYDNLQPDPWIAERDEFWLVVPMLMGKRLFGFIILLKPRIVPALNFEDHDLLRTVGCHVGTHIKQAESDKRLAESSQFGTYHRLSAFLMHDLNNLIAQQSLVVKNAERHRHDPKFVDDTIETIAHSVTRMRRLMEQLSSDSKAPKNSEISVQETIRSAVRRNEPRSPIPSVELKGADAKLNADRERLTVVLEHLIRNAQDASTDEGSIEITNESGDGVTTIEIRDAGCGMSPEFISQRLFRPFDSTKGSQSMGIGAYQAREYVRMIGGQLEIKSEEGQGTTFSIKLPVSQ